MTAALGDERRQRQRRTTAPAGARDDIAADVEDLTGGGGEDTLTGTDGANTLRGGNGDDRCSTRAAAPTVSRAARASTSCESGLGNDVLIGGGGPDLACTPNATVPVTATLSHRERQRRRPGESDNLAARTSRTSPAARRRHAHRLARTRTRSSGNEGATDTLDGGGRVRRSCSSAAKGSDAVTYAGRAAGVDVPSSAGGLASGNSDRRRRRRPRHGQRRRRGRARHGLIPTRSPARPAPQTLEGLGGDDTLDGGFGADVLDGGTAPATSRTTARARTRGRRSPARDETTRAATPTTARPARATRCPGSRTPTGGSGDDPLIGAAAANRLEGIAGNDTMSGAATARTPSSAAPARATWRTTTSGRPRSRSSSTRGPERQRRRTARPARATPSSITTEGSRTAARPSDQLFGLGQVGHAPRRRPPRGRRRRRPPRRRHGTGR